MVKRTEAKLNGKNKFFTKIQLKEVENIIRVKIKEARDSIEHLKEVTSAPVNLQNGGNLMPNNMAEQATDNNVLEMDLHCLERDNKFLVGLEMTLERLLKNPENFGICYKTDEPTPIPFNRLLAVPTTQTFLINGEKAKKASLVTN